MKSPFDPVEDYTVHEITLGPGCNVPGYAGTTIGYISTLPTSQAKRWTNEQPRIDIYIDQIMTVSGWQTLPDSPLPHYLMLILSWVMTQ